MLLVDVFELAIGIAVAALCVSLWRAGRREGGRNLPGLVLAVAAVAAYFGPLLWRADWAALVRAGLVVAIVGAAALGYARLVARARRAAAERDRGR
jgi:hypothetical protein